MSHIPPYSFTITGHWSAEPMIDFGPYRAPSDSDSAAVPSCVLRHSAIPSRAYWLHSPASSNSDQWNLS